MIKLKEQEFEKKLSLAEKVPKILHSNEFMEFFPYLEFFFYLWPDLFNSGHLFFVTSLLYCCPKTYFYTKLKAMFRASLQKKSKISLMG